MSRSPGTGRHWAELGGYTKLSRDSGSWTWSVIICWREPSVDVASECALAFPSLQERDGCPGQPLLAVGTILPHPVRSIRQKNAADPFERAALEAIKRPRALLSTRPPLAELNRLHRICPTRCLVTQKLHDLQPLETNQMSLRRGTRPPPA